MNYKRKYLILLALLISLSILIVPASAQPTEKHAINQTSAQSQISSPLQDVENTLYSADAGVPHFQLPNLYQPLTADLPSKEPTGSIVDEDGNRWSSFYYLFIPGSVFFPRTASTDWVYGGSGCIYTNSGGSFVHNVTLPDLSRIDYVRMYYYDASASYCTGWLTVYDGQGGYSDLTSVTSANASGYGSYLSPFVNYIYDQTLEAFALVWSTADSSSAMRLCGFRIAYRVPDDMIFMPMITN